MTTSNGSGGKLLARRMGYCVVRISDMVKVVGSILVAFLALTVSHASQQEDATPLRIPKAETVQKVVVSGGRPSREEIVIKDTKQIKRLLTFLRARNDDWKKPIGTPPIHDWTINFFKSDKELLLLVTFGVDPLGREGELGGREGESGLEALRYRTLSKQDLAELSKILGLAKK